MTIMVNLSKKGARSGAVEAFSKLYGTHPHLIVGEDAIPVDEFLLTPLETWIDFNHGELKKRA